MSVKDYRKVFVQLNNKLAKAAKYRKHNSPKSRVTGIARKKCRNCGRRGSSVVGQYKISLCRQCFREKAKEIGFKKFS